MAYNLSDHHVKHLELIQAVVSHMAQNSFMIKSWAITIMAAILVLAEKVIGWQFLIAAFQPKVDRMMFEIKG